MKSKKAQTSADYLSFVIFGIIGTFIIMGSLMFIYVPMAEQRIQFKINNMMVDSKSNLFITYYLNYGANGNNMADIITGADHNGDYTQLTTTTSTALETTFNKKTGWKISIDDNEVTKFCDDSVCSGKSNTYLILLPSKIPNQPIKFQIEIYQNEE